MRAAPTPLRWLALAVLAALMLSGCVYLRLYAVYGQLQNFDANFTVPDTPRLTLEFRKPRLRRDDLTEVLGAPPSSCCMVADAAPNTAEAELLTWRFSRVLGAGEVPEAGKVLEFTATVRDGRVTAFAFPAQVDEVITRATALAMLKALGRGKVDTGARRVDATYAPPAATAAVDLARTSRARLEAVLGAPNRSEQRDGRALAFYDYRLDGAVATDGKSPGAAVVQFDYGVENDRVRALRAGINKLWLSMTIAAGTTEVPPAK